MSQTIKGMISAVVLLDMSVPDLKPVLAEVQASLAGIAADREILVIANGAPDEMILALKELLADIPDVTVFCLSRPVDRDIALLAGMENAIGDLIVLMEPDLQQARAIPALVDAAGKGYDVVIGDPTGRNDSTDLYDVLSRGFFRLYRRLTGIDMRHEEQFRLLTRPVSNYVVQHEGTEHMITALSMTAGFPVCRIAYAASAQPLRVRRSFSSALNKAIRMLLSSSAAPIRAVSLVAFGAAILNLVYAVYVLGVLIFKDNVIEGWTTLSLQMSGMFFLFSLLFALVAEYILQIHDRSSSRPRYYLAQELRSNVMTRKERLNVVDA